MPLAPRSVVGNLNFQSNSGSTITFDDLYKNLFGPVPANSVFAGAASGGGLTTFRTLVAADIPSINSNFTSLSGSLSSVLAAKVASTVSIVNQSSDNLR